MKYKWLRKGLLAALQAAVLCVLVLLSGYFLMRYCAYGEHAVSGSVQEETEKAAASRERESRQSDSGRAFSGDPENGKAAFKEAENEEEPVDGSRPVRVRIMSEGFESELHEKLRFSSSEGFSVSKKKRNGYELEGECDGGDVRIPEGASELVKEAILQSGKWSRSTETELEVVPEELAENEVLVLESPGDMEIMVESLKRAGGVPGYRGRLYVWREEDGLALLNVLPLETYLYSVVSSEMPSNYPLEAQKAQAVCARTYAVNCMGMAEMGALAEDVTDSVDYQVYNNYPGTEISVQAVNETAGERLPLDEIQYYSTSCLSEHRADLDSDKAFAEFLQQAPEEGAEYGSRWLRWQITVSKEAMLERIKEYTGWTEDEASSRGPGIQIENGNEPDTQAGSSGNDLTIRAEKRRGDGQIQTLQVCWKDRECTVEGEYNIRKMLGNPGDAIILMDGSQAEGMKLLPSAFFCIEAVLDGQDRVTGFLLRGGGYGHGNGMSQCGAAAMAEKGMDYEAIIGYYYAVTTEKP